MGDDAAIIPNRRRGSILLALKPRFTDSRNATTAAAESKRGNTMAVSLWVADPPQLSLFSIDCTKPKPQHTEPCNFRVRPHVVGADGPFVLICCIFESFWRREFFLYKAGDSPSLELIPCPDDDLRGVRELGILGLGHGGHYLLAALRHAPSADDDGYQLQIYSSETKSWSTRALPNPCPGVDRVIPDKVITLGGGLLGWVDLSQGLLVCDLLLLLGEQHLRQDQDQPPDGRASFFIPLPEPLPGNRYKLKYPIPPTQKEEYLFADEPSYSASWFRDLTCVNGVLKFIEMENPPPENKEDNVTYDSDLIMSLKRKAVDGNPKQQLSCFRDAWRAVTWTRNLVSSSSSNCWRQTCAAHVADIKEGQQLVSFRDFYSAFPILSPEEDGDMDILYLRSLLEPSDRDGSVVALDIGNKSLKAIGQYYLPDDFYYHNPYDPDHPFRACTLSRHLDMTAPGIQVSECRKITEASSSSANHPSETSIRVGSCKPRTTVQTIAELAEKVKRARNNSTRVRPTENNLLQQQCFNKWDYPPGNSVWTNQNNLSPEQCFDFIKPGDPGYASLAPVYGRHNYLSLRPPSKQQSTSSSESGPHEAPQPCFTYFNGASYHEQIRAPNPFPYGAHTGYGNYQQQWHQLTPTVELPSGASWQHPPHPVQRHQHLTP